MHAGPVPPAMTAAAPSSTRLSFPEGLASGRGLAVGPCSAARAKSNCHPWAEDSWLEEMALSRDPQRHPLPVSRPGTSDTRRGLTRHG